MPQAALPGSGADGRLRRRRVPTRDLGDRLVVARPRDGAPVVIASTSAFVWQLLEEWTTVEQIDRALAETFPEVTADDRRRGQAEIMAMLTDDELVERG